MWINLSQLGLEHLLALHDDHAHQWFMVMRSHRAIAQQRQRAQISVGEYCGWLLVGGAEPAHVEQVPFDLRQSLNGLERGHRPQERTGRIFDRPTD